MIIDLDWNFSSFMEHIEALRSQYKAIIASFSYLEEKEKIKFIYETKSKIYSLKFEKYKREKIWEYFNDYTDIKALKKYL